MAANSIPAVRPGLITSGSVTYQNVRIGEAPKVLAASSTVMSRRVNEARMVRTR